MRKHTCIIGSIAFRQIAFLIGALLMLTMLVSPTAAQDQSNIKVNEEGEPLITLMIRDQPIDRVLSMIRDQSGITVRAEGKAASAKVNIVVKDMPFRQVLDELRANNDWEVYSPEGEAVYVLVDKETYMKKYAPGQTEKRIFQLHNIPPQEFQTMIEPVLTPDVGSSFVDVRTGQVIVTDLPQVLSAIEEILNLVEVKLHVRVFQIEWGDIQFIFDVLQNESQSFRGVPSDMVLDLENKRIIVKDTLEHIKKLETWVELLDERPEYRTYPLKNVGVLGQNLDMMQQALIEILSPNAYFYFDYQNHILVVRDVPRVHEDIERILSEIDQAPQQILIQAEIVETRFKHNFNWSTDVQFSEDFFAAVRDGLAGEVPGVDLGNLDDLGNLGFEDFREEFPFITAGSGGIRLDNLSKHALITFRAAMSNNQGQLLSQPRLYLKNHELGRFTVGGKVPFLTTTFNDSSFSSNRSFRQDTQDEGITVDVEVAISAGDLVEMDILIQNNTATIEQRTFEGQPFDLVGLDTQEVETRLIIPNGNTRVIGGLLTNSKTDNRSGIPFLARLPWIGGLFGSVQKERDQRNLLIFLTPYIIRPEPSPLTPEPPAAHKERGRDIVLERDVQMDKERLKALIEEQVSSVPMIDDEEAYEGLDGVTSGTRAMMPGAEFGAGLDLEKAQFTPVYADIQPFRDDIAELLGEEGRILSWDARQNRMVLEATEAKIQETQKFLTDKNIQAARNQGVIDPPEQLKVPVEEPQMTMPPAKAVMKGFDPKKGFTTFKPKIAGPAGVTGEQQSHRTIQQATRPTQTGRPTTSTTSGGTGTSGLAGRVDPSDVSGGAGAAGGASSAGTGRSGTDRGTDRGTGSTDGGTPGTGGVDQPPSVVRETRF